MGTFVERARTFVERARTHLACVTDASIGKGIHFGPLVQRRAVRKVRQWWQRGIPNVRGFATRGFLGRRAWQVQVALKRCC